MWSRVFWDIVGGAFLIFMLLVAGLVVWNVGGLKTTLPSKVFVVLLAGCVVAGALSTNMWMRCWRKVQWEMSFWRFVRESQPADEFAAEAWRWGRRVRLFWWGTVVCMLAIATLETIAGNWK